MGTGVGRSSYSGESTEACVAIGNGGRQMNRLQSHALGLIGSNRASIGEIGNLLHMFGAPSEGTHIPPTRLPVLNNRSNVLP